jgi:alpha-amylase
MKTPFPHLLSAALLAGLMSCAGTKGPEVTPDTTAIDPGQQMVNAPGWEADAIVYHVWVKAFADGIYGDGIGDLPGLRSRLDHLQSLGVTTLWLSPIFACDYTGENMHGYDTTDYFALNPRFGRKADLKALLDDAHGRGMRVIFDFVPNHTSSKHPWFTDTATRGTRYVWKDAVPAGWGFPWGGGTSTDVWRPASGGYFYTSFATDSLADLNWESAEVRTALQGVATYWLDRGFDGMRVDAARYLHETGPGQQADQPATHARWKEFRTLLDGYTAKGSAKVMIAEAWTDTAAGVIPYQGTGTDEFHLTLDFSAPWAISNAITRADATQLTNLWEYERDHFTARSAVFDSNHDNLISRPATQYGGDARKVILHEALVFLAPGTPILYYGNEVGMTGQSGTDLNLRQPMDWAAVGTQSVQPDSVLAWCKYLTQARRAYPALRGTYAIVTSDLGPGAILAYVRGSGAQRVIVVANLSATLQSPVLQGLSTFGIPTGGTVQAILGDLKGSTALQGDTYRVQDLPPYGVRVLHAAGPGFAGTLHGDRP